MAHTNVGKTITKILCLSGKTTTLGKYSSYTKIISTTNLYCLASVGLCFSPVNNKARSEYRQLKRIRLLLNEMRKESSLCSFFKLFFFRDRNIDLLFHLLINSLVASCMYHDPQPWLIRTRLQPTELPGQECSFVCLLSKRLSLIIPQYSRTQSNQRHAKIPWFFRAAEEYRTILNVELRQQAPPFPKTQPPH